MDLVGNAVRGSWAVSTATFLAMGVMLAGGTAQAAKFKVLHSFCEGQHRFCGDGSNPQAGLVMDSAGNLFGTTAQGGKFDHGVAFELERKDSGAFKFKTIFRFCPTNLCQNGTRPTGALIVDTQGNLYGTAYNVVFELTPSADRGQWSETVLYHFCSQQNCTDGSGPVAGLTYAGASSGVPYDGVSPLFGTTTGGGATNGGTAFELTNNGGHWSESVIYSFCSQGGDKCTDGSEPLSSLLLDSSGNLYGTAVRGGNDAQGGVVFELSGGGGAWTYTVLYRFCSANECVDGSTPTGPLAMDAGGNLLGVTGGGGAGCKEDKISGCGTIFELMPNGPSSQETVLYSFCRQRDCKDGRGPQGGIMIDASGNLFGTTSAGGGHDVDQAGMGGGTAFEFSNSALSVLYKFCSLTSCADGEYPQAGLIIDQSGTLYGMTSYGGEFGGNFPGGTVYRVTPK